MSNVGGTRGTVTARAFLDHVIIARHFVELCIVGILKQVDKSGTVCTRGALLSQLKELQACELRLIKTRPRTALALYRLLYDGDVAAARETIVFLKQHDLALEYGSQSGELK